MMIISHRRVTMVSRNGGFDPDALRAWSPPLEAINWTHRRKAAAVNNPLRRFMKPRAFDDYASRRPVRAAAYPRPLILRDQSIVVIDAREAEPTKGREDDGRYQLEAK